MNTRKDLRMTLGWHTTYEEGLQCLTLIAKHYFKVLTKTFLRVNRTAKVPVLLHTQRVVFGLRIMVWQSLRFHAYPKVANSLDPQRVSHCSKLEFFSLFLNSIVKWYVWNVLRVSVGTLQQLTMTLTISYSISMSSLKNENKLKWFEKSMNLHWRVSN